MPIEIRAEGSHERLDLGDWSTLYYATLLARDCGCISMTQVGAVCSHTGCSTFMAIASTPVTSMMPVGSVQRNHVLHKAWRVHGVQLISYSQSVCSHTSCWQSSSLVEYIIISSDACNQTGHPHECRYSYSQQQQLSSPLVESLVLLERIFSPSAAFLQPPATSGWS